MDTEKKDILILAIESSCDETAAAVGWTRRSAGSCKMNSVRSLTQKRTAFDFTTWARSTRIKSNTSAASRRICPRNR